MSTRRRSATKEVYAFTVFENAFKEFGLPNAIRTDNGVPFASPNALFNLSRLSVWWLRLGIAIERIKPGHPQQNGRRDQPRSVGRSVQAGESPARFARAEVALGMISKRPLLKDTFGFEMHLML